MEGYIYGINGPVISVKGNPDLKMMEMTYVGNDGLIGEVIGIREDTTIVQCYESTTGLQPGEPVRSAGKPLSATLGPGLIGNIFDGIERPLRTIYHQSGIFIGRGITADSIDMEKIWQTKVVVKEGDLVTPCQLLATVDETKSLEHRILAPDVEGTVVFAEKDGGYPVTHTLVKIEDKNGLIHEVNMVKEWPVRQSRPYKQRLGIHRPLITGQRIIDTFFPIGKGGTAAIPGGFGTGKTMTQHQLAKWSDADLIIYIGCGERGNEMTQVLEDFSKLADPQTGNALMDRTILIANTSNMPVAAREACIYTGITIAEYFRDMGYHVAIMADSTSRWAEALREISGRLEEMPAEEGFPAYLPSRISGFYERAGYTQNINGSEGSVTIIGAVSPQGDDFSEPVTQNTKRFIRVFWALDRQLAYARHFPAINWLESYSEYMDDLSNWYRENVNEKFIGSRAEVLRILQQESQLMEIVKLIGADVLPDEQKIVLELSRVIRIGLVQQNAYHESDTYVPLWKQYDMMEVILYLWEKSKHLIAQKIPVTRIKETGIFEELIAMKYETDNKDQQQFQRYLERIDEMCETVERENSGVLAMNGEEKGEEA